MSTTPNILILWTDQQRGDCLGAVNPAIRTPNLDGLAADSTLIVFHSDHGEPLNQFGIWGKGVLYRGATHVPLMVKLPGQHTHRRYGHPVGQVDLLPTLLDALGLQAPAGLPGRSLLPACTGADLPARDAFIEWEESRDTPAIDPLTCAAERVEASQRWRTAAAMGDPAAHRRRAPQSGRRSGARRTSGRPACPRGSVAGLHRRLREAAGPMNATPQRTPAYDNSTP